MAVEKYRKKPVIIEALQFDGSEESAKQICAWAESNGARTTYGVFTGMSGISMKVNTLEGTMLAGCGDWVIRGVKGEFYPCKPDIFEATYEKVEE